MIIIMIINQNGFVLHRTIHTYITIIITTTINNNSMHMYKFNQNSHICYKWSESRMVVYRSNKNVIFEFMITRYDEFDANTYKMHLFHTIHNKIQNFGVIVCVITVNTSIISLIKMLGVAIQSIIGEIISFIYISVTTNVNVVLIILIYQFNAKIDTIKVCLITKGMDDFHQISWM